MLKETPAAELPEALRLTVRQYGNHHGAFLALSEPDGRHILSITTWRDLKGKESDIMERVALAVNSHDDLVAALRKILDETEEDGPTCLSSEAHALASEILSKVERKV